MDDPYGIDIALTATGDVVVWPNGAVGTLEGPENAVQAMRLRMRTWPGELTLHPEYGSAFGQIVGKKYSLEVIQAEGTNEVRRITEQDARFLAGRNVEAHAVEGKPTAVRVAVELTLAGGERVVISDITQPDIEGAVEVPDGDLEDLNALADFDEFIAQDDEEADDLRDAALLDDLVATFDPDIVTGD